MGSIDRMGIRTEFQEEELWLRLPGDEEGRKTACECHVHILSISIHHAAGTNENLPLVL